MMANLQLRYFMIRGSGDGEGEEALNRFLRSHQVLDVRQEFVANGANSSWYVAVRYAEGGSSVTGDRRKRAKIDYKDVLQPEEFARFVELRKRRKQIAEEDALPAFAVFTDEELAGIARLADPSLSDLRTVKGIGEKKAERFGQRILGHEKESPNEAGNGTV